MNTVKAVFHTPPKNSSAEQPKTSMVGAGSLIVSHKGELITAVTVRTYYASTGTGMQPVRACVWIDGPRVESGERLSVSGRGSAGGCGYHKESAAIAAAVSACGVSLHGSWSERSGYSGPLDFGGTGSSYYPDVFKAIARAAGYRGRMLWVSHGL